MSENPKTFNIHTVDLNRHLEKTCENVCWSQSRRINYIKPRDGDRFSEYLDRADALIAVLQAQEEKDLPEADARGLTTHELIKPTRPQVQNNPFINLLAHEIYEINIELCYGPSSKNTSGLHEPDLRMLRAKIRDARKILADGRKKLPTIHFPYGEGEGVRGAGSSSDD